MKKEVTKKQKKSSSISGVNILAIILCLILLPVLIVNVTLIVKGLANDDKVPTFNGYAPLIVLSDSMYPAIESGDLIVVKSIPTEDLKEGDPIAFFDPDSKNNAVVTHRIVEVVETEDGVSYRTKGDANSAMDQTLVPAENVVGIWTGRVFSGVGRAALFIQSVPGLILCIGVPVIILVAVELIRRRKYEQNVKKDTDDLMAELEELRALKASKNI